MYIEPVKRISDEQGMEIFRNSQARARLLKLIESVSQMVNACTVPDQSFESTGPCKVILGALKSLDSLIDTIELSEQPQRFGNVAFREWHRQAIDLIPQLFHPIGSSEAWIELDSYLRDSFGSPQRLDYGSGHELNFFAFLGGLFIEELYSTPNGKEILAIMAAYYDLIRHIIRKFNLEPAGSHGVWGLDDHFHILFIFGAAQLAHGADNGLLPQDITVERILQQEKDINLYFGQIAFTQSVKRGQFFEHSPMLHDISGVVSWTKVYRGMLKMYQDTVLGKLPVMQHLKFGSIYSFEPAFDE